MTSPANAAAEALEAVRIFIYSHVADTGAPPTNDEIAAHFGITQGDARDRLHMLGVTKRVILNKETAEIWMCGPFSAVPTRFRVHGILIVVALSGGRARSSNRRWCYIRSNSQETSGP